MRIWITGSSGSGKSTLSNQIGKSLDLKVYHRDQITWQENWVLREKSEQIELIKEISCKENWIFDGNKFNASKLDGRYETCDVLIHIDTNRFICLFRVIGRYVKHRNKRRDDLAVGCEEDLDLAHLGDILFNYPKAKKRRESFFKEISKQRNDIQVITNKSSLKRWTQKNNIV